MSNMTWTKEQEKAIHESGKDILVAAAAGSGKTAVLVERIITKIIDQKVDINELLVVTFTNASAKEMKHRLYKRIIEALKENPSDEHLKMQMIKIHQADISTLHRFCLNLIQKYYYAIDIDPAFRTGGTEEISLILMQAVDEVLEEAYKESDESFLRLNMHLSTDRRDDQLRKALVKLFYFAVANPNPIGWLDEIVKTYETMDLNHPYFQMAEEAVMIQLNEAERLLDEASKYLFGDVVQPLSESIDVLKTYIPKEQTLQSLYEQIKRPVPKIADIRKKMEEDEAEGYKYARPLVVEAGKMITEIQKTFLYAPPEELLEDIKALIPEIKAYTKLTKQLIERFQHVKNERKVIDFSDYEHFALRILRNEDGSPSEIARNLSEQYNEILVDEYQDTNKVQEAILQCIKRHPSENGNLFMVGDVKQSIYRFRQADPSLFIHKYHQFKNENTGEVIDLSRNFRSRVSVINDTNKVFSQIMDETIGEIKYDEAQMLYYGAPYDERVHETELNIIDKSAFADTDVYHPEAEFIASKIQDIIDHGEVYDVKTKTYRKAMYKDIVILERGYANAVQYMRTFKERGIPFHVNSKTGYFQTDEINTVMSLLRIIDNPLQDIHLAGVMRSILYQFDEHMLAEIRALDTNQYFYQNMIHYLNDGSNTQLKNKIAEFVADLEDYREKSRTLSVKELMNYIYEDALIPEKFLMIAGGRQREANLKGLISKAEQYEQTSFRGLYQFIVYIDNLIMNGNDFGEENIVSDDADVVRMMTVHASKGLEFPYVIYSGLSKKFNMSDSNEDVLMSQDLGLTMKLFNPKHFTVYPVMLNALFKDNIKKANISEEIRLMYVAFTRAREKLILCASVNDSEKLEAYKDMQIDETLDVMYRNNAGSVFKMMAPLMLNPSSNDAVKVNIITELDAVKNNDMQVEAMINDDGEIEWLKKIEAYQYPYAYLNHIPTKESVSEIKKNIENDDDMTTWTYVNQYKLGVKTYEQPAFLSEQKKTRQEIGTLVHLVMQHFPFDKKFTLKSEVDDYVKDLISRHIISEDDYHYLKDPKDQYIDKLFKFTQSELYEMMHQADEIYHELPFVIAKRYLTETDDETLVQGMIDCVFKYEGKYYFVDYKTDHFTMRLGKSMDDVLMDMKERYSVQMYYYKKALEAMLRHEVGGYLYFFEHKVVEV